MVSYQVLYCRCFAHRRRLFAGTLVVGVRGALFRGYEDYDTAKQAFSHAEADGVVVWLNLVVPLDMRFLQM